MKFDKEELKNKFSSIKLKKNDETDVKKDSKKDDKKDSKKEVKKSEKRNNQALLDFLDKSFPSIAKLINSSQGEKDSKVKRNLKQSERGIFMIVCSLAAGFVIYNFLYIPATESKRVVEEEYKKTEVRRSEIATQLQNQSSILSSIDKQMEIFNGYKAQYPNFRTENEILKVVENMLLIESTLPNTFIKGNTVVAQKSKILSLINNKGLQDKVSNLSYFQVSAEDSKNKGDTTLQGDAAVSDADKSNFEYTEVSFSVQNISKDKCLNIMNLFAESKRVVIPVSLKMLKGAEDTYSLDATLVFFAYRGSDIEPLF